jgi:hypothetical protein
MVALSYSKGCPVTYQAGTALTALLGGQRYAPIVLPPGKCPGIRCTCEWGWG